MIGKLKLKFQNDIHVSMQAWFDLILDLQTNCGLSIDLSIYIINIVWNYRVMLSFLAKRLEYPSQILGYPFCQKKTEIQSLYYETEIKNGFHGSFMNLHRKKISSNLIFSKNVIFTKLWYCLLFLSNKGTVQSWISIQLCQLSKKKKNK